MFTVKDDGDLNPVTITKLSDLSEDNVFIIADENSRKIFIWKGEKAPVRRKFMSAKAAQTMRQEKYGMVYRIESLDPGLEGADFLALFGATPAAPSAASSTVVSEPAVTPSPAPTAVPRPSPVPTSMPRPSAAPTTTAPKAAPITTPKSVPTPVARPTPAARPVQATTTTVPKTAPTPTPTPVARPKPRVTETEVVLTREVKTTPVTPIEVVSEKLKELEIPPNMEREIVIIGNTVFSVIREHLQLFSKEVLKLEPMDDLPSGAFPAEQYQVRLFIEEGKVLFIEMLRQKTISERDEFIEDMKQQLQDLSKLGL